MAVAVRDSTGYQETTGSGTTVPVPRPTIADGDMVVVGIQTTGGAIVTDGAGFGLDGDYEIAANTRLYVLSKVIGLASGEPATYTFDTSAAASRIAVCATLSGHGSYGLISSTNVHTDGTHINAPVITSQPIGSRLLVIAAQSAGNSGVGSIASGATVIESFGGIFQMILASDDAARASVGSTAARTVTWSAYSVPMRVAALSIHAASGTTVAVTQASSTSTAQGVTANKAAAVAQASSTSTAQGLTPIRSAAVAQASSTSTAHDLTPQGMVGQASSTAAAQNVTSHKAMLIEQASSINIAGFVMPPEGATYADGQYGTAMYGVNAGALVLVEQAISVATAQAVTATKRQAVSQASDTTTAQAATAARRYAISQASDTTTAGALTAGSSSTVATATGVDTAMALVVTAALLMRTHPSFATFPLMVSYISVPVYLSSRVVVTSA